jgi:hypothetical protein
MGNMQKLEDAKTVTTKLARDEEDYATHYIDQKLKEKELYGERIKLNVEGILDILNLRGHGSQV